MTGFANSEEDYADQVVGQRVMPFRIEDEAKALGAEFIAAPAFQPHALADGHLITGQQQAVSAVIPTTKNSPPWPLPEVVRLARRSP